MTKTSIIMIAGTIALTACGGGIKNQAWNDNIKSDSQFYIRSVDTNIVTKCPDKEGYMTATAISDQLKPAIRDAVCAQKKCTDKIDANTIVMDVHVNYARSFMGEPISCLSYQAVNISYTFTLERGGVVFYTRPASAQLAPSRGVFGNLGRIATQLSFTGDTDNEKADLEYIVPGLGKQIAKDLK